MSNRFPIAFILLTVAINALGIGLIVPVMPDLILQVRAGDMATAAQWGGVLATCFAVMQFLFAPLLGNLSDRYGRRPVLLLSLAVMAADYLVMALAQSIWLLLLGRIIGGIAAATAATAAAALADISPSEKRAARFGMISAAFGLGFVIGPVLGGMLGQLGPRAPFYAAAAIAALNVVLGWLVLPETVTDKTRRPFELWRANPLGALRALGQRPGLQRLLGIGFLYEFAYAVYPSVWAYFAHVQLGWQVKTIGLSLAVFGLSMVVFQGVLIRPILAQLGARRTVQAGFAISAVSMSIMSQTHMAWVAFVLIPFGALGAVSGPALQGLMSQRVGDTQQGELQGAITSLRGMALGVSPLVMTQIFAMFTREGSMFYMPGAPFLMGTVIMLLCAFVFVSRQHVPA